MKTISTMIQLIAGMALISLCPSLYAGPLVSDKVTVAPESREKSREKTNNTEAPNSLAGEYYFKPMGEAIQEGLANPSGSNSSMSGNMATSSEKPNSNFVCSFICYANYAWAPDEKSEQMIHISASDQSSAEKIGLEAAEQVCLKTLGRWAKIYSRREGNVQCKKKW